MPVYLPYNVAEPLVDDADVLQYRPPRFWSDPLGYVPCRMIAIAGRDDSCHTALAYRDGCEVKALGMRLRGGNVHSLRSEIDKNPGLIEVYKPMPTGYAWARMGGNGRMMAHQRHLTPEVRAKIVQEMRYYCDKPYGWRDVLRASPYFIPFARWLMPAHEKQSLSMDRDPFCSMAADRTYRNNYVPLLRSRTSRQMLPGDVATSGLLHYVFTLCPAVANPNPLDWYLKNRDFVELRRGQLVHKVAFAEGVAA